MDEMLVFRFRRLDDIKPVIREAKSGSGSDAEACCPS